MKTTSYEISKKLKEIVESNSDFVWIKPKGKKPEIHYNDDLYVLAGTELYNSYDLETILENIPFVLYDKDKAYWFKMDMQNLEYITFEQETNIHFYTPRQKDESLADTAARLFIKLYEKKVKC